jgi:hypothetical protein
MSQLRYACSQCGTWTCSHCGWSRPGASLLFKAHNCASCGQGVGTLVPTMHTAKMWWNHNGQEGTLPQGYPYGQRPAKPAPRDGGTERESYRGVLVPRTGPYARLDVASWKRGVDDVLDRKDGRS